MARDCIKHCRSPLLQVLVRSRAAPLVSNKFERSYVFERVVVRIAIFHNNGIQKPILKNFRYPVCDIKNMGKILENSHVSKNV